MKISRGCRGRPQHRHQQRHAQRRADLTAHRQHRRARGEALGSQRRCAGAGQRGDHQAHAGSADHDPRQVLGQVGGRVARLGDVPDLSAHEQQRADDARDPVAQARPETSGGNAERGRHRRAGEQHQPGFQHALVPHAGEEQHTREQHRAEAREEQDRGSHRQAEAAHAQHRRLHDRRLVAFRAPPDGRQPHQGDGEQREDRRRSPAPFLTLDDRHHQRADRDDQRAGPEHVRAPRAELAPLPQRAQAEAQPEQPDRDVHQEHPAPVGLHQQTAERGACRRGDAAGGGPYADRHMALVRPELGQHQAQ
jgi:hypothetical protein